MYCKKIDCGMNAQQSSYLSSVHHVMSHVTHNNCLFNKKAVFSVRTYNQSSHMISTKKRIRKRIKSTEKSSFLLIKRGHFL